MCYDPQTSIKAFLFNIISSFILLFISNRKSNPQLKVIALFFLFVGAMQLWDYIFWTNPAYTSLNNSVTKIAAIWNHSQPIVLALLIIFLMKTELRTFSKVLLIVYVISSIFYLYNGWGDFRTTEQTKVSGDALQWKWNNLRGAPVVYTLFLALLTALFWQHFDGRVKTVSVALTLGSFFFSLWKYQIKLNTGRFWCYFAAFAPIIYTLI